MNLPPDFAAAFEQARKLQSQGRLAEAEQAYRQLAASTPRQEEVLSALADMYRQSGHLPAAADTMVLLTEVAPDTLKHYVSLAGVLDHLGRTDEAIEHFHRLLSRRPDMADAHFNLALLYKSDKRYAESLAAYEKAIELDIDGVEEVYSNMGVLFAEMHQTDRARAMYEKAVAVDVQYVPALFNLAGLYEEEGNRDRAIEIYRRILSMDAKNWESLSRLAHAQKVSGPDDPLIGVLRSALEDSVFDEPAREGLYFALGKVLDDAGQYDEAFKAYVAANELCKQRTPGYDRAAVEQAVDELISLFDRNWIEQAQTTCKAAPVFICGMFRSGSTLTEQILAAHPSMQKGDELDILPWLVKRRLAPFPTRLAQISAQELEQVAAEYLSKLDDLFPGKEAITDKRPGNVLYLGLIRAMFPSARIVCTKRNLRDNCLSVYFQHLGNTLPYANDLTDIAHYYGQLERLQEHWRGSLGDNVFTLDYDELVREPEPVLRALLAFLGLEWDDRCLDFHQAESLVKTASIWQVRDPLYTKSSGRWRNYQSQIRDVEALQQEN